VKIIVGVAMVAGMIALNFIPGGSAFAVFLAAHYAMAVAVTTAIATMGAGLVMGGIAETLTHTAGGAAIASRNPVAPWQVIYGQQMVGGTVVDIGETGSHDKYLHLVIVTACHQTQSFGGLWLDGKQVHFSGDPLSGCSDDGNTHYDLSGMPYNFKGRVYCQALLGAPGQTACADYIAKSNGHWTYNHTLSGRSYIYLRLTYDTNVFPNGMPGVKSLWNGKCDILDPRTGLRGYSTNAALCINDFLMNQDYGFRCAATEINQTALIGSANLCDTMTVSGTIEPLYALNGVFNLSDTPGTILNNMLSACAGQISYNAGQFSIYAAAWRGPSVTLDQSNLLAPIKYRPKRKVRELYNCVRGTFLSPNGPDIDRGPGLQRGQVNAWDGQWSYTDIPDFAEDTRHGYATDVYNVTDGQTLYLNTKFPFTTSVSTCQRLAKIMLERNRQQGSGTLVCSLAAYGITPLTIIEFSYPRFGWVNKLFEITGTRLTFKADGDNPPIPMVELDISETDPKVYAWSGVEELGLSGQASPLLPSNMVIPAPTNVTLHSGPDTVVTGADGAQRSRILVSWTSPASGYVTSGGKLYLQWMHTGGSTWEGTKTLAGSDTSCFIDNVTDGASYTVQVAGITGANVSSSWVQAGPLVVSNVTSVFSANNITYPTGETVASLKPAQAGADVTSANTALDTLRVGGTASSTVLTNITTAQAAATAAQTTATAAQTSATAANTALAVIANDNILSKGEKSQVIADWAAIANEQAGIDSQAAASGISQTAYNAAVTELGRYLGTAKSGTDGVGIGGTDWSNVATDSAIDGPTFRTKFTSLYGQRQALLNAIAAQAQATATSAANNTTSTIFIRPNALTPLNSLGASTADSTASMGYCFQFTQGWTSSGAVTGANGFVAGNYDVYIRVKSNGSGNSPTTLTGGIYDNTAGAYALAGFPTFTVSTSYQEFYVGRTTLTAANLNHNNFIYFSQAGITTLYSVDYVKFVPCIDTSTGLNGQGSIIPNQIIAYSTTYSQSSVGVSVAAQGLLRPDGSTYQVNASSLSYSGLSSGTAYHLYPFISVATGNLMEAGGTPVTTANAVLALQAAADGCIPLGAITITTSSTGGGTGGGGGGIQCPESQELVDVQGKGKIPAGDVVAGEYILGHSFATSADVYKRVIQIRTETCHAWRMIDGHKNSPCESVFYNGQWMPAYRVPGATLNTDKGVKVMLSVEADSDGDHNFYIGDLLIHNQSINS